MNINWLYAWLGVFAVLGVAAWGLRSLRRQQEAQDAARRAQLSAVPQAPVVAAPINLPPAPSPGTEVPTIHPLALAKQLHHLYESVSHPVDLLGQPQFEEGVALFADPAADLEQAVTYAVGANEQLAAMGAEALARRGDSTPALARVARHLRFANVWTAFFILRFIDAKAKQDAVASVLAQVPNWWARNPLMPQIVSDFIDSRIGKGERMELAPVLDATAGVEAQSVLALLDALATVHVGALREAVSSWHRTHVDAKFLASIGRMYDAGDATIVVEHETLRAALDVALQALSRSSPQSILITGEPGVGKSALFRALATRLQARGWSIFDASAAEVLAGQVHIGELEQRVQQMLEQLDTRRRVLWHVAQFHELFYAGRHRFNPQGVLDLFLPAVEAGRLCIVGEIQPDALQKLLQARPRLRFAFKEVPMETLAPAGVLAVAEELVAREFAPHHLTVDTAVLREAIDLTRHYLGSRAQPGNLIELLRVTKARLTATGHAPAPMSRGNLLASLAELTGLPRSVLDEQEGLNPSALREFFQQRVMGQPEAVDCLVDRVAMLKAGLTDPNRPIGVFLFAGPTGTGKTEVAKTLAEFLFGSQERMIRLDMSEFQEQHSLMRILGGSSETSEVDSLVQRIRNQPFAVVLLDEFEKAHPRVWDLFLQVFDDGRLTDAQGNVADFRHSIIVLTSNLGATDNQGSSLGFTQSGVPFTEAQVLRSIAATFRPEFVNRIDRVVVFRPLAKAVMRSILKKELNNVLQRRGFRSRDWAVEWEASAIEFLLEKGFTRDQGARPLRRAIEQYLLAPIAMTIVENRFPEGDQFLFVRSDATRIQVEFVDPDATEPAALVAAAESASGVQLSQLAPLILTPRGNDEERRLLSAKFAALDARFQGEDWLGTKAVSLAEMNRSGFWGGRERHAVLAKIELMDRMEAGFGTARSIMRRLDTLAQSRSVLLPSLIANLAHQIYLLECALADIDAASGCDVFVSVEPVATDTVATAIDTGWVLIIAGMYKEWGRKRRMHVRVLREPGGKPDENQLAVLAVSGFGAHHIMQREAGLHLLETPAGEANFSRQTARVRVVPQSSQPKSAHQTDGDVALAALSAQAGSSAIVRRYRREPSPLVRDSLAGWRTGRLDLVIGGDFDLMTT